MKNKKVLIVLCIILFLLLFAFIGLMVYLKTNNDNNIKGTIIAVKEIGSLKQKIKYEIKYDDYTINEIKKEINCNSEEEAQLEYERYETINEFEGRNIELNLNKKTLMLNIPIAYFEEEIGYNEENNEIQILGKNEQREIINISLVKDLLKEQGYTIK